jgi:bifunctional non-homologous end joining protein LigD
MSHKKNLAYQFTNPDRILFPEQEITKYELAEYYLKVKDWILPHMVNRPLSMFRCPKGYDQECFFQKHLDEVIKKPFYAIDIQEKEKIEKYIYIKNIDGLFELVQRSVLEIHLWGCHIDNVEKPDMITFDLDPADDIEWKQVIAAAYLIREELANINLTSFVKTTGGKGLHIVIPIKRLLSWDKVKEFASLFAEYIEQLNPKLYVVNMSKAKRHGKIFIDYLRNTRGATAIAPYSARAKKNAPIATPLAWKELTKKIKPNGFTLQNFPQRLKKLNDDPWKDFFKIKQSLPKF